MDHRATVRPSNRGVRHGDDPWKHNVAPKNAAHVATALLARVPDFDTFDGDLIRRRGEIGDPPLINARPTVDEPLQPDRRGRGWGRSSALTIRSCGDRVLIW